MLARFRLTAEPSVLVTVAMAYEGSGRAGGRRGGSADPRIRSRAWLEQMIARVHPGGPACRSLTPSQRALVFHPDDPLFARFRHSVETEQGTVAKRVKQTRAQSTLPGWLLDRLAEHRAGGRHRPAREQRAGPALRTAAARPRLRMLHHPEQEAAQTEMLDPPSVLERTPAPPHRRDGGAAGGGGRRRSPGAAWGRAVSPLQRHPEAPAPANKPRAQMSLSDLEAAVSWLERNRLADHAEVLKDDPRYGWTMRQHQDWTYRQSAAPTASHGVHCRGRERSRLR